jgi:DNA-directed RNA polymerase specialized sigma24 family protein
MEAVATDITQDSDAGLLLTIGAAAESSAEDQALAREALRILHARHYGYLLGILEGFAENLGTVVIDPEEFAIRVFKKAFQVAGNYDDRGSGDADESRSQVRAWLGQIARNLARDELDRVCRLDKRVHLVVLNDSHDVPEASPDENEINPTHPSALAALREALTALKPEEQDILITYALFGFPTESGRELSEDDREALMLRTGYERSNIRQKWRRLSMRLRTQLEPLLTDQTQSLPCRTKSKSTQPTK